MTSDVDIERMRLGDRKVFALLTAYAQSVDPHLREDGPELSALRDPLLSLAKNVREERAGDAVVGFLKDAVARACTSARAVGPSPDLEATIGRLETLTAGMGCEDCPQGHACRAPPSGPGALAPCINELHAAFKTARDLTWATYGSRLDNRVLDLQFNAVGRLDPTAIFPGLNLAVNGATVFADNAAAKVSEITVRVSTLDVDRAALTALPGVMLHEIFCHGVQMLDHAGPRPNKGDQPDALSEGMVDAVAAVVMERRAAPYPPGAPEWRQANLTRLIHDRRANLDVRPRYDEAVYVALGANAYLALTMFFTAAGTPAYAEHLALDLNLHGWGYVARAAGMEAIRDGLGPNKDVTLVEHLLDYAPGRSIEALVQHLLRSPYTNV